VSNPNAVQPHRTVRMANAATALAEHPYHPGWAILFVEGEWFIGDPAHYPSSAVAVPPRCQVTRNCIKNAGHIGECRT